MKGFVNRSHAALADLAMPLIGVAWEAHRRYGLGILVDGLHFHRCGLASILVGAVVGVRRSGHEYPLHEEDPRRPIPPTNA